jgi:antitoxin ChpS
MRRTAKLRSVGGSTMVAIPPNFIEQLQLRANATVGLSLEAGKIVIRPETGKGRIGLKARLKMCDFSKRVTKEERDWIDAPPVGREEI